MKYPYKYPMLYGELAMQGKTKRALADALKISVHRLNSKQNINSCADFSGEEMRAASRFLEKSVEHLFGVYQ